MTITVRLDATLAKALDAVCTAQGVTRRVVVQEALCAYLAKAGSTKKSSSAISANLQAFVDAGLVGCCSGWGAAADKAAVRAAALLQASRDPLV
jgi:predicted transcriptional regulator